MEHKYIVYSHISPSGKVYIGQTCQSTKNRWKNGNGYSGSPIFYKAIKKYGWNNFEHNIIASGLTADEANSMEIELIDKYKKQNLSYNVAFGGGQIVTEEIKLKIGQKNKGRIIINNGVIEKHIYPAEKDTYLQNGWERGVIETTNRKLCDRSFNKGRIPIYKNEDIKRVKPDELDYYLSIGWEKGMPESIKEKLKYTKKGIGTTGRIRINKSDKTKYVLPDELDYYLSIGWEKGLSKECKNKISKTLKNTNGNHKKRWVYNNLKRILVNESELSYYLNNNWIIGMGPFPK